MSGTVTSAELDGNVHKTPLVISLPQGATARARDVVAALGRSLPCTVSQVVNPWVVEVTFAVNAAPFVLQPTLVPVNSSPYVALPIQVGDQGVLWQVGTRLGALSGLGAGTPNLTDTPANLATGLFQWLGNASWTTPDPQAVVMRDPTSSCFLQVSPIGAKVTGPNANLFVDGNLGAGNGASGSFTTPTGQTVVVTNGIITNIF
jgi:hypothetical protein